MNSVVGIDLGTSSVKILKKYRNGQIEKFKNTYEEPLPLGWWKSVCNLLEQVNWEDVAAIGLSSQVGTYLINNEEVISWNSEVGKKELDWWKTNYTKEKFVDEISMPHPDIISYPLPRLKYISEHYKDAKRICQPKEYIIENMTGAWVSDWYSWRGLTNLETGQYSSYFLNEIGMAKTLLPPLGLPHEIAGYTKEISLGNTILPAGIPVYVGLNDYYAGLLGMGIQTEGQMFDVTGTSEHLGVLQNAIDMNTTLVSGPYLEQMVHYGVTASSGSSIKYALKLFQPTNLNMAEIVKTKPPIFLPYVKGERAPIWNADARGAFFGIEEKCTAEQMAYGVLEGVVFSLYHIYETMRKPDVNTIRISGGAAEIEYLNKLKAEVFGVPVEIVEESDVSGLGACMTAAVGLGWYSDYSKAAEEWVKISHSIDSDGKYQEWFQKRFALYKEFYSDVKTLFQKWKEL